jgi:WXG100 family type VII secretion target
MANITLRVRPDVLNTKSVEMNGHRTRITQIMEQAKQDINSLGGDWKSAAASEYQGRFRQIYDDIDNILAVAAEHISDLKDAAQIYTQAEQTARIAAEGLPTDGVRR